MKYPESHHETGLVSVIDVHGLVTQIDGEIIHDGLNLVVTKGDILGVVGASGSGKTVLMETLVGLRRPFAGRRLCLPTERLRSSRAAIT